MSNRNNRHGATGGVVVQGVPGGPSADELAERAFKIIEATRASAWPPAIPVSVEPEEGKPLMAWYEGAWHEAVFTKFWTRDKPEWRSHPAGAGISPTHYQLMPPDPTKES